jgi:diadenosine tetraphosphate (Ap4A) HIT family hydrolase
VESKASWRDNRIESAVRGENPTVLARMKSGFAVIGDTHFLPGYCVLLGYPKVRSLNDLSVAERLDFLKDMTIIGDVIMSVCKPDRVNYEILGNTDEYLHAHIFPRYLWEDRARKVAPVWLYPSDRWVLPEYQYDDVKHGELRSRLTQELLRAMALHYC